MRTALLIGLLAFGCGRDNPAKSTEKPAPKPVASPASPSVAPPTNEPAADEVSGTVSETMDAGGYTYALLDHNGKKVWVAGPQTKLAIGTVIDPVRGSAMPGFRSDTLDRTFDQIYFISSFPIAGGAAAANPHMDPRAATSIEKVKPFPGGTTVGKIFEDKATLAGKAVVVRGKVTKVNNGILGRNWVHLQDGTGGAGTNDLMVTTSATTAVGDVVVVRGKVAVDKDFGGGYRYAVLVEDASFAAK
ncbi:MAG: DNA-binding protein [Myxococcota bacterium]|nr:DNA-binding protein [Myxococcota bacterium]